MIYKGVLIERNIHGYFTAWIDADGRYVQYESLENLKQYIRQSQEREKELQCHYR